MIKTATPQTEEGEHHLVLGLDIGIGSCGWSIIDRAQQTIVDMGVRLWDPPQESKTKQSLAATRRQARSARRNMTRGQVFCHIDQVFHHGKIRILYDK